MSATPSFLFAGDRSLAVSALRMLVHDFGHLPRLVCVSDGAGATHAAEIEAVYREAGGTEVLTGSELGTDEGLARLRAADLDFALSVHFPHLVRRPALDAVRLDWLNLHPAYLPYNRGWHTPTWSLLEGTPAGATIHVMVEEVDAGPILARQQVEVSPADTAHTLYERLLATEVELLRAAWPTIASGEWELEPNPMDTGTTHRRAELFTDEVQRLDRDATMPVGEVLDRLRALTTNQVAEAAWFEEDGVRYRVRVEILPDAD